MVTDDADKRSDAFTCHSLGAAGIRGHKALWETSLSAMYPAAVMFTIQQIFQQSTMASNPLGQSAITSGPSTGLTGRAIGTDRDRCLIVTLTTYEKLTTEYEIKIPLPQFVGLCGYLCVLLRWGWHIKTVDMDAFVQMYQHFENALCEFEEDQSRLNEPAIPAYHQWFLEQPRDAFSHRVLDEKTLRQLWRENHYEFLRAELSLIHIIKNNSNQRRQGQGKKDKEGHDVRSEEAKACTVPRGPGEEGYPRQKRGREESQGQDVNKRTRLAGSGERGLGDLNNGTGREGQDVENDQGGTQRWEMVENPVKLQEHLDCS